MPFWGGLLGLIQHFTNPLSDKLIGAAIEVHRHLGPGLLESAIMPVFAESWNFETSRTAAGLTCPSCTRGDKWAMDT
jgi:hypothetical protein